MADRKNGRGDSTPKTAEVVSSTLSLDELRSILSDEILNIREGNATAARVHAISNATGKILQSVKLQMEYYKMTGQNGDIPLLNAGKKAEK